MARASDNLYYLTSRVPRGELGSSRIYNIEGEPRGETGQRERRERQRYDGPDHGLPQWSDGNCQVSDCTASGIRHGKDLARIKSPSVGLKRGVGRLGKSFGRICLKSDRNSLKVPNRVPPSRFVIFVMFFYFILFYFILFYFILFYFISFYYLFIIYLLLPFFSPLFL